LVHFVSGEDGVLFRWPIIPSARVEMRKPEKCNFFQQSKDRNIFQRVKLNSAEREKLGVLKIKRA
jgi:hypothetical protein